MREQAPDLEARQNSFDAMGLAVVQLSSTEYLMDKFKADVDPEADPNPQVYMYNDYGQRELVPAGVLVTEGEFLNDANGDRIPDGQGGWRKRDIATGYIDADHHMRFFGRGDMDAGGKLIVPELVKDRLKAVDFQFVDQVTHEAEPEPEVPSGKIMTAEELNDILLKQSVVEAKALAAELEQQAGERDRQRRQEARVQSAVDGIQAEARRIAEVRQQRRREAARAFERQQAAGLEALLDVSTLDHDGTMTMPMQAVGTGRHSYNADGPVGRHAAHPGAVHDQRSATGPQPHAPSHPPGFGRHSRHRSHRRPENV